MIMALFGWDVGTYFCFKEPKANKRSSFSKSFFREKAGLPLLSSTVEAGNFEEIIHLLLVMEGTALFFFFLFPYVT